MAGSTPSHPDEVTDGICIHQTTFCKKVGYILIFHHVSDMAAQLSLIKLTSAVS